LRTRQGSVLAGLLLMATLTAHAQDKPEQQAARRIIGALLSTGGYFFTHDSARAALGDVYFYNETFIYGRPKRINDLRIAGGLEIANANSNFFPFTGGNQFTLIGPSVGITTRKIIGKARPFFGAGLYWGQVQSDRLNINTSDFTPGLEVGVEWSITKDLTLSAGYRLQEKIGGIDTSGVMLSLRIF
jgi:hypothetical protein